MHQHPPKNAHTPPPDHTDSQILAVVYQKVFEIDERLFGDGTSGELPQIRARVSKLEHMRSMFIGAGKLLAGIASAVGAFIGIQSLVKLLPHK